METKWWKFAQSIMDDSGDSRTESARKVGIDLSNYTRWSGGTLPKPEVAVRFARAYHVNVLQALVALGLISEEEAQLKHRDMSRSELLSSLTDIDLASEILNRAHKDDGSVLNRPLDSRTLSVVEDSLPDESLLAAHTGDLDGEDEQ